MVGVLPLMEVRTLLFGHTLISLPFCQWAGPLANDKEADLALREAAVRTAQSLKVDYLELRNAEAGIHNWPAQDQLYVIFKKSISTDNELNLKEIPRKQRAMVRKGIANGLSATDCSLEEFYALYTENVHRHGTPCAPITFFNAIKNAFGADCETLIVRSPDGTALSSVLTIYWRNEVFPFYAGDTDRARREAANDFKYWEVMQRGAARGCGIFNFGRSKRGTGSYDFKCNWGFKPKALFYEYAISDGEDIPSLNPSNPKFELALKAWRRMPRWLVNRAGPVLVRGLG